MGLTASVVSVCVCVYVCVCVCVCVCVVLLSCLKWSFKTTVEALICIYFFKCGLRWNCTQLSDTTHTSMVFMTLAFVTGKMVAAQLSCIISWLVWASVGEDYSHGCWRRFTNFPELQVLDTFIAFTWDILWQWDATQDALLSTWVSTSPLHVRPSQQSRHWQ